MKDNIETYGSTPDLIYKILASTGPISEIRLIAILYLIDHKHYARHNEQLTDLDWKIGHGGPYIDNEQLEKILICDKLIRREMKKSEYGGEKLIWSTKGVNYADKAQIVNDVLLATKPLYHNELMKIVFATGPVSKSLRHGPIDFTKKSNLDEIKNTILNMVEEEKSDINKYGFIILMTVIVVFLVFILISSKG
jgi:hypothetical protein